MARSHHSPQKIFVTIAILVASIVSCIPNQSPSSSDETPSPSTNKKPPPVAPAPPASGLIITGVSPSSNLGPGFYYDSCILGFCDGITISGSGFSKTTTLKIGGQVIQPLSVSESKIKFSFHALLAPVQYGPLSITVENPDGEVVTKEKAFFYFSSPYWARDDGFPEWRVNDIAVSSGGSPLLATSEGPVVFNETEGFVLGNGAEVDFCPYIEFSYDYCPTCLSMSPPLCLQAIDVEVLPDSDNSLMLLEELWSGQRMIITSADDIRNWSPLQTPSDGTPLSIRATDSGYYILTSEGVVLWTGSGWGFFVPASYDLKEVLGDDYSFRPDFPFGVYEGINFVAFFVGTPDGLFIGTYNELTQGSSWLRLESGAQVTTLVVNPMSGDLYFSIFGGGIRKIPFGQVNGQPFSPIPSVYDLKFAGGDLLATGWAPSAVENDSIVYRITPSGSVSHIYSPLKTLGLPRLPSMIHDEVSSIEFSDGRFFAALQGRGCLFTSQAIPEDGVSGSCLGAEGTLVGEVVKFLFLTDGNLFASTEQGSFRFDNSTSRWEPSDVSGENSLRQDLNFSAISQRGWPPDNVSFCALEIPELGLFFRCDEDGVHVNISGSDWHRLSSSAPIVSLAYQSEKGMLYGASSSQGIFRMPLP